MPRHPLQSVELTWIAPKLVLLSDGLASDVLPFAQLPDSFARQDVEDSA